MDMWIIGGLEFHCLKEIMLDLKKIMAQTRMLIIIKMKFIIKSRCALSSRLISPILKSSFPDLICSSHK